MMHPACTETYPRPFIFGIRLGYLLAIDSACSQHQAHESHTARYAFCGTK